MEVAPGARVTGIDVTLARSRVFRVRGRVVSATGAGVGNASITLGQGGPGADLSGFGRHTAPRNAAGEFEFPDVPPGSWEVAASQGEVLRGKLPVEVADADVDDVRLIVGPGGEVRGHVSVEGDKKPALTYTEVFLTANGRSGWMPRLDADDTFTLRNLPAERHTVSVQHMPEGLYVKSVRSGQIDVLRDGLLIPPGATVPLEVVLASDGGGIEGAILDKYEQPVPSATVVLVPEPALREGGEFFKTTTTNQYGHYEFRSVRPGDYTVFSWADVEPEAWEDPEFLAPFEKRGTPVKVRAEGHEKADAHIIAPSAQ